MSHLNIGVVPRITSHYWVMSHESCNITLLTSHAIVWRDAFLCVPGLLYSGVTWLFCMCDTTHLHDSFIRVTWLVPICDPICDVTESCTPMFRCDMTQLYVWNDSFICVTWLIHMCDMTHSCVWCGSFICVRDMTHSCVWCGPFMCVRDMTHL